MDYTETTAPAGSYKLKAPKFSLWMQSRDSRRQAYTSSPLFGWKVGKHYIPSSLINIVDITNVGFATAPNRLAFDGCTSN